MGGGGRSRVDCTGRLIVNTVEETDAGQQPINGVRLTARGPSGSRTRTSRRRGDGSTKANFGRLDEGTYTLHVGDRQVGTEQVMAQATTEATVVIQRVLPTIQIADPKIVLVEKEFQEQPHRIRVDLGTNIAFDGWALLSCNRARQIQVYDAEEGGSRQRIPMRIPGEDLTGGVTLYIQGAQPSSDVNGTTLTLELRAGSSPVGDPARDSLTCVELQLDICRPRPDDGSAPVPLRARDKNDPGRMLQRQDTEKTKQRAMLIVRKARPHTFAGNLVLNRTGNAVDLFTQEDPAGAQTALTFPRNIANGDVDADDGEAFWVEGTNLSAAARDSSLQLGLEDVPDRVGDQVTITVIRLPLVRIETLDKWFIPDAETCDVRYALEGMQNEWPSVPFADKVVFDVYASNYCSATVRTGGTIRFRTLRNPVPVYRRENAPAVVENSHDINDWEGETNATSGALQARTGQQRYINVAFSPYTFHFRFYKNDADRAARILLHDFWPRWNDAGAIINDSLRVRWEVQRCSKLRIGRLRIVDKNNNEVHTHNLGQNDLSLSRRGAHEYQWDGAGINQNLMPYRVQIYAYSNEDQADGVAVAAMHTEVRLYAHSDTGTHPANPVQDTNSFEFALAPFTPNVPTQAANLRSWYQYQLAEAGFHPGPVTGRHGQDTRRAISEFQRSYPSNTAAPFARLTPNGRINRATTIALGRLAADARSMFADPANRTDLTRNLAQTRLNDKTQSIIAWIDDRNYYTQAGAHNMFMRNYHGRFTIGDGLVRANEGAITRPWIPLEVSLPLRKKNTELNSDAAADHMNDATTRRAIGPVRVSWTFTEIDRDLTVINTGHANYVANITRTSRWVRDVVQGEGDDLDGVTYTNCPERSGARRVGGIRPTDLRNYYREAYGLDAQSLAPWRAMADRSTRSVCTLAHDDVGQNADNLHNNYVGKAGVYLNPSRIAGDGYRFRAAVSFDQVPGGAANRFPNQDVLRRRYSRLPQAHTAGMRMWRKTSYRGYIGWLPAAEKNWGAPNSFEDGCTELYRAAFMHFIHESGAPVEFPMGGANGVITAADYQRIIQNNIRRAPYNGYAISFHNDRVWPYCDLPRLGIRRSPPGTQVGDFYDDVLEPAFEDTWDEYLEPLLFHMLRRAEETRGILRGHLLAEFRGSQLVNVEQCRCPDCGLRMTEIINNLGGPGQPAPLRGNPCPSGCTTGAGAPVMMQLEDNDQYDSLPLWAVGLGMGATWLFNAGGPHIWAHELGHHRHLEHCQSQPNTTDSPAGFQNDQHDSRENTFNAALAAEPAKDRGWDRGCIMSYNDVDPNYFCGKCILKNRGWAVEHLTNPAGNIHDGSP